MDEPNSADELAVVAVPESATGTESVSGTVTIDGSRRGAWIAVVLLAVIGGVAAVGALTREGGGGDAETAEDPTAAVVDDVDRPGSIDGSDDAPITARPTTPSETAGDRADAGTRGGSEPGREASGAAAPPAASGGDAPAAATGDDAGGPAGAGQTGADREFGIPVPLPNGGLDAWLFAVGEDGITRTDLLTGDQRAVELDAALALARQGARGDVDVIDGRLVVVASDQVLVVDVDTLEVRSLAVDAMRFLAAGDEAIWTTSASFATTRIDNPSDSRVIHRISLDDGEVRTIDMELALPFPFLITAPVPGGLLVSEILGATWLVRDDATVERRDDIGSVLGAGDDAYLASTCAPDAMRCTVAIHHADGSVRPATISNEFSFDAPMSPDGRWIAGVGGFVDVETGVRLPRPRSLRNATAGSWSADSRWFAEPGFAEIEVYDLSGEFETLLLPGFDSRVELELVLR